MSGGAGCHSCPTLMPLKIFPRVVVENRASRAERSTATGVQQRRGTALSCNGHVLATQLALAVIYFPKNRFTTPFFSIFQRNSCCLFHFKSKALKSRNKEERVKKWPKIDHVVTSFVNGPYDAPCAPWFLSEK